MVQIIRKIGNSQGILLPRALLQQVGIETAVDVEIVDDALILRPVKKHPRDGWDEAFQLAQDAGEQPDADLFEGMNNQFDQREWTW